MCKISVVIPIYNIKDYIHKCIESILNQTFTDFELLLIDDGSSDGSQIICDEYQLKDNRITVIHKKNGGLSSARNTGIKKAKGKYICFIDGDDYIDNDMLEIMYEYTIRENADIVEVGSRWIYPNKTLEYCVKDTIVCDNFTALEMYLESRCFTAVAWNKLYRLSLFEDIKYPEGCLHEDIGTTYKLLYKAKNLVSINQVKYNYIQRNTSISYMKFTKSHLVALEFWEKIYNFIKDINHKKLISRCYISFIYFALGWYVRAVKSGVKDKEILEYITRLVKHYSKDKDDFEIPLNLKVTMSIFLISPSMYVFLKDKKDNILNWMSHDKQ